MIYGLNFNQTEIPKGWARRFAKRIKIEWLTCHTHWYRLVGVATDRASMHAMLVQADNGHRLIHIEERHAVSGPCFGIYVY